MIKEKSHGWNYKYASVTTILGCLRKAGLEMWYKYNTLEFCNEESKKGKEVGTDIHTLIQQYVEGSPMKLETKYPAEVNNAVESFLKFKEVNPQYELKRAEIQLDCDLHKYSGQLDCMAQNGKDEIIIDWKSGKPNKKGKLVIYDEYIYQVSMYVIAYEWQFRECISKAVIVLFDKTSVDYITRDVSRQEIQEAFEKVCLPCLSIYNYQHKGKKEKK